MLEASDASMTRAEALHESSIVSDEGKSDTVTSSAHEYFNAVEAGRIPIIPISTAPFLSTIRNANGETLLITAARCGHSRIVEHFINDIDFEETDSDGWTALLDAAYEGHARVVKVRFVFYATKSQ